MSNSDTRQTQPRSKRCPCCKRFVHKIIIETQGGFVPPNHSLLSSFSRESAWECVVFSCPHEDCGIILGIQAPMLIKKDGTEFYSSSLKPSDPDKESV